VSGHILGIHGIGRHSTQAADVMRRSWFQALQSGVPQPLDAEAFGLTYYREAFVDVAATLSLGPLATFSSDELEWLTEVEDEAASMPALAVHGNLDSDLGGRLPAIPPAVGRLMNRLDRRLGPDRAAAVIAALRQVHHYLSTPSTRERVHDIVVADIQTFQPDVVVGHSLGSLVLVDLVAIGKVQPFSVATIGSPLGWDSVRVLLVRASGAPLPGPGSVHWWLNGYDKRDLVTGASGISHAIPSARDLPVTNPLVDVHGAESYLSQPRVAQWCVGRARGDPHE